MSRLSLTRRMVVTMVAALVATALGEAWMGRLPLGPDGRFGWVALIDRYREVTIAQGYVGDSILNSISDIIMAGAGFLLAWHLRPRTTVVLFVAAELLMLVLIRDNLTLNILMLLAPLEGVRLWQMAGR